MRKKPLTRGWSHALAALLALVVTGLLCWLSRDDLPRMITMLIFGLSMVIMYTVSAIYHIVTWTPERRRIWRALDHANIFLLIAGTYTPICFNVLVGWQRITMLVVIWVCALVGMVIAPLKLPRWVTAVLYVAMGWIAVFILPTLWQTISWQPVLCLIAGGVLYTIGAVVYAVKRPDPFPAVWGYHEIFHLFVIAGSIAFTVAIWIWVLPFPRVG